MIDLKNKNKEKEQRELLKREWLAREAAQSKRIALDKVRKEKDDAAKLATIELEQNKVSEESKRLKLEQEQWEQKKIYEKERKKEKNEIEKMKYNLKNEMNEKDELSKKLKDKEEKLIAKEKEWRAQREATTLRENELNALRRQMGDEKLNLKNKLENEIKKKNIEIERIELQKEQKVNKKCDAVSKRSCNYR